MSLLNNSNAIPTAGGGGYNLENSLRFRSSASAYLNRTPATAGNRRTFTLSCWVKLSTPDTSMSILSAGTSDADRDALGFSLSRMNTVIVQAGTNPQETTTARFRDPSGWYHAVWSIDTTQAIDSNRIKMYINNELQTNYDTTNYPVLNQEFVINSTAEHRIGKLYYSTDLHQLDGYITEVNFVDGQALTPSDFGDYNSNTGVWQPKEYTGTYGTNGFYLPFKPTTQATGFNTVTYTGNGTGQSITGAGFSPDLVWIKSRSNAFDNTVFDTIRGAGVRLITNTTAAETATSSLQESFDSDGFTLKTAGSVNQLNSTYAAWCWDAGSGSPVSNTDGTITTTIKANPATGFSVVTYTGTGVAGSIGHGLGVVPKLYIIKQRTDAGNNWIVQTTAVDGSLDYLFLNATNAKGDSGDALPTSSVINISGNNDVNGSGDGIVAYTFADVAGYQKIGSYTGNGSTTGPVVTTGFRPAFVMVKRTDGVGSWEMHDNTRSVSNPRDKRLFANLSNAESTSSIVDFNDTGFQLVSSNVTSNASGGTYIYLAIADTRDAQFNFDDSGNKNNWTANNINSNASGDTTYDIMTDVPTLTDEDTANFAVLNPLASNSVSTLSNANLDVTASTVYYNERATIELPSSGKWYFECYLNTVDCVMGVMKSSIANNAYVGFSTDAWAFLAVSGNKSNGSAVSYASASAAGQTIGIAMNMDNGELTFYRLGASLGVAYTIADTSNLVFGIGQTTNALRTVNANFGQRPFSYTPPTGFKKLNTFNLPDSSIVDGSENFNPVLYTGTGEIHNITGVGFQPDFTIVKSRSNVASHNVYDSVRGIKKILITNGTAAEVTEPDNAGLDSFDTDGFTIDALEWLADVNILGRTYVAWNWKAGGTAVSNTDGTLTTTVSANPTAGFSIVKWTGTSSGTTMGHGLGATPKVIISKPTSTSGAWHSYFSEIPNMNNGYIVLESTAAFTTGITIWGGSPNTTTFTQVKSAYANLTGQTYIAYCFAEVEGYSKFGSYTGNGSTNGPFVYTGFKPAWIMVKPYSGAGNWFIMDATRDPYNVATQRVFANLTNAEDSAGLVDFTSNGFKLRMPSALNDSANYIFMAFAENPFKNSLAR